MTPIHKKVSRPDGEYQWCDKCQDYHKIELIGTSIIRIPFISCPSMDPNKLTLGYPHDPDSFVTVEWNKPGLVD